MDMKSLREITARYTPFFFSGLLLFGLYLASLYSYLFAHSLAELFSVVIGCNIFIVAWNSRQRLDNHFFLFLGIAYLFVSLIDLLHILAYKGISVFVGYNANLPTQLWIAARYCQSLSLLVSPLFLRRKLNIYLVVGIYMTVIAVVLAVIFGDVFPTCYVEGVGLTPFKKISEYIISGMLFFSIGLFLYKRQAFDSHVVWWLVASLVLTIASEMSLTLYTGVYDLHRHRRNGFGEATTVVVSRFEASREGAAESAEGCATVGHNRSPDGPVQPASFHFCGGGGGPARLPLSAPAIRRYDGYRSL
jgi:hypothetical protein